MGRCKAYIKNTILENIPDEGILAKELVEVIQGLFPNEEISQARLSGYLKRLYEENKVKRTNVGERRHGRFYRYFPTG